MKFVVPVSILVTVLCTPLHAQTPPDITPPNISTPARGVTTVAAWIELFGRTHAANSQGERALEHASKAFEEDSDISGALVRVITYEYDPKNDAKKTYTHASIAAFGEKSEAIWKAGNTVSVTGAPSIGRGETIKNTAFIYVDRSGQQSVIPRKEILSTISDPILAAILADHRRVENDFEQQEAQAQRELSAAQNDAQAEAARQRISEMEREREQEKEAHVRRLQERDEYRRLSDEALTRSLDRSEQEQLTKFIVDAEARGHIALCAQDVDGSGTPCEPCPVCSEEMQQLLRSGAFDRFELDIALYSNAVNELVTADDQSFDGISMLDQFGIDRQDLLEGLENDLGLSVDFFRGELELGGISGLGGQISMGLR